MCRCVKGGGMCEVCILCRGVMCVGEGCMGCNGVRCVGVE